MYYRRRGDPRLQRVRIGELERKLSRTEDLARVLKDLPWAPKAAESAEAARCSPSPSTTADQVERAARGAAGWSRLTLDLPSPRQYKDSMPELAARAEIRYRRKRKARLVLAIGMTTVLWAAWLSDEAGERTRRHVAVARATPSELGLASAPSAILLVPPVGAVEEAATADSERSRRAVAPQRRTPSLQDLVRRLEADRVTTLAPVLASLRTDGLRGELHGIAANLDRMRSDESVRISLAAMSESLRISGTLTSAPAAIHETGCGESFSLGGQGTLRGFDFREVHAEEPETQE